METAPGREYVAEARRFLDRGDIDMALNVCESASRRGPEEQGLLAELAREYAARDDFAKASDAYAAALRYGFMREESKQLIRCYKRAGRWAELGDVCGRIYGSIPDSDLFVRNLYKNEIEISENRLVLESMPRSFTVTLTNRCNLKCVMCEVRDVKWELPGHYTEELVSLYPYLEHIMWQGGEVFMYEGFLDILAKARDFPDLHQVITSNGLMLDRATTEELVRQPYLVLTISVDGVDKKSFESIRKGADFTRLLENLHLIDELREKHGSTMRLNMNVTVMKDNFYRIGDIIDFAAKYRFSSVFLAPVTGDMNDPQNIFLGKNRDEFKKMLRYIDEMRQLAEEKGIDLENRLPVNDLQAGEFSCEPEAGPGNGTEHSPGHAAGAKVPPGDPHIGGSFWFDTENPGDEVSPPSPVSPLPRLCYAPWQRMYIDWWGYVFPDCMCIPKKPAAHSGGKPFLELWNSKGMQMYRRKMIESGCKGLCQAGCISGRVSEEYRMLS